MKRIQLVNSSSRATVDDEDYGSLMDGPPWRLIGVMPFYASRTVDGHCQQMAYAILGPPPPGMVWDHRNGNGLDNRRANLRAATLLQNAWNSCKPQNARTSRFKGVGKGGKRSKRWRATIKIGDRLLILGSFVSEEDAARAYDEAARRHCGEFACVNFPRQGERCALRVH